MPDKPKRLRWRREPRAKGLAATGQKERCYELWYGDDMVGQTAIMYDIYYRREIVGYYWYDFRQNTSHYPLVTVEEAKAECEAYVREQLGLPPKAKKVKGAGHGRTG